MKKILILLFTVLIMLSLVLVAGAQETQDSEQWSEVSCQEVEMSDQWSVVSDQEVEQSPTSYPLHTDVLRNDDEAESQMMLPATNEDACGELSTISQPTSYPLHPTSFKAYIEEKILPIMVGVVTSIIALLSTLKGIFSSLKSLKETKKQFDTDREKIKTEAQAEIKKISEKYNEIKEEIKTVCQIGEGISVLTRKTELLSEEIANLSKIASLGFSESKELVSEGKQREIVILANKNKELIDNEEI